MPRNDLAAEYVRSILDYDPETGVFRWKVNCGKNRNAGKIAGATLRAGYRTISIDKVRYYAHRLAWLIMTGEWPNEIDHKELDRSDNRWGSLRSGTHTQNCCNTNIRSHNKSGFKGVYKKRAKWAARIVHNGVGINLGVFATPEEAATAYDAAAARLHGEFARTN